MRKKIIKNGYLKNNEIYLLFDSVDDIANVAIYKSNVEYNKSTESEIGRSWWGGDCQTSGEVRRLVRVGWPEGVEKIQSIVDSLNVPLPVSRRRKLSRGHDGDFDVHSVYRGAKHYFTKRVKKFKRGPQMISLAVDMCAGGSTSSETLFWRGAACLKVAQDLILQGYKVEVIAFKRSSGSYNSSQAKDAPRRENIQVVVKQFDQTLEVNNIAVTVAVAGFYRSHLWTAIDSAPFKSHRGFPIHETPDNLRGDHTVDRFDNCYDLESTERFINKVFSGIEDLNRGLLNAKS